MSQWIQAVLNAGTFKAWAKQLWKDAPMRARQVLIVVALLLLLAFCTGTAFGATVTEGPWTLYRGSSIVQPRVDYPSLAACAAAADRLTPRTYTCRTIATVVVEASPVPVNCAVSAWSGWTGGAWGACSNGSQSRTETRSRTITTQPANGGQACPVLTETRTATQPCAVEPPATWTRAAGEGQSFMLYAPATVRYGADTRWVERSFPAGMVECGNHVFGDPAYNTVKSCEVQPASALQPVTPPPPATGSAILTWQRPTLYVDNSPLPAGEIAGYGVWRGSSAGSLTRVTQVGSAALSFTVEQLPAGTHYFAVTTVATNGAESAPSGVGSKTVP